MRAFALQSREGGKPIVDVLIEPVIDFSAADSLKVIQQVRALSVRLGSIDDLLNVKRQASRKQDLANLEGRHRLRQLGRA
jgi:hypothetical protein